MVLRAENIVKRYGGRTVVNGVSIEVNQGEIVGVLGPNGAGKTTSFYMIVGLVKPNSGKIFLDDRDITKLPMFRRSQLGIGYLAQEASVFRELTVEENILAPLQMRNLSKQEQKDKMEELIEEFRLKRFKKTKGKLLSGGERRRAEIARAVATNPNFILLDEPFAGVDPIAVENIQMLVAKLKQKNIGVLITDHNANETLSICDRVYIMFEGDPFASGTPEEVSADNRVKDVYFGRQYEYKRKIFDFDTDFNDEV
ncbi:ABC-type (unclassified) transport system, ATPase component [Bernardetia litoralis DSM 6794]|uniref:ABC-type (Unclassified) transport system, ATPase component n=1 Tax=Bernardetia litoralis (strain ATCC 23117 / DSM 6794 / NBRC 15988 / NCIMB 1366 / Fx l1 / Sio-4) TaxID=880071 RepID=I4AN03_BERLS|nr:LPS export ABC transporter ATP-binding protein [Bernardetia litoralis]AFM05338.1 ABC-type (unclassified) transport system, ATPase component [Bernardetia litoralis DSM 6794]